MTAIEQLRDEIANLHLLADRLARKQPNDEKPKVDLPTLEECEALYHEVRGSAVSFEPWKEGISAVRALCLASRSPSHELVEAADALRNEMTMPSDGSFAPFVDRSLKDKIEAYDAARSRLAAAQPAEHPESIGGLASRTPASKQGKKALDDMLLVFAKHDDDEEDCWTQPARRGVQYVSDLEWDLETQVRLASHRAEANESLRIMLSNLAAYTGTHFGPDEPLKNYERVRKTLTDKPEPPAPSPQAQGEVCEGCGVEPARTYSADDVHLCVKCARENVDGSSLPAPEESATAQDGEPTLEDCQRAAIEATRKLHPNASDLALLLSPDEAAQVAAVRSLCLAHRAPSPSPALAAIVEAGDAMQNAGHLLRTSCYQVQVTPEARMWDDALAAYDRARAALPKGGAA